jgi:hypothetical protein
VVCDFYAKAYFAQVVVELPVLTVSLPLYAEPTTQVPSCQAVSPIARGPPSAC